MRIALLAAVVAVAVHLQAAPPNIVLILADDLGHGDLSCYGSPDVKTPNIDRIAAEGVLFRQFYANGPECSPTRTALMTGRYQQRVGGLECAIGTGNHGRYDDAIRLCQQGQLGLPASEAEIPRRLGEVGYQTAIFGKWHLGYEKHFSPVQHGWGRFFGPLGGGVDYFHHTEPLGNFLGDDLPGEKMLYAGTSLIERKGYLTELITDEAVRWLQSQPNSDPFFLYVPYTAPHTPLQGPGDYRQEKMTAEQWNRGTKETYIEMIEAMDAGVGSLLAALHATGASENTVVVFFSDNGPTKLGDTGGLRGTKGNVFEGGIRVPCVARYPGVIAPGLISQQPFISMDVTASILRLAGAQPQQPLDGIDMLQEIQTPKQRSAPRPLFWRKRRGAVTVKAMRLGDWKLVVQQDGPDAETYLYHLAEDLAEQHDRSAMEPDRLKQMNQSLANWEKEVAPRR